MEQRSIRQDARARSHRRSGATPHGRLRAIAAALAFGMLIVIGAARAEERVVQEADRTVVRKRTVIDFADVAVEGELSKPEGSYSVSKRKTTFKTLLRVRDSFSPELRKSIESL